MSDPEQRERRRARNEKIARIPWVDPVVLHIQCVGNTARHRYAPPVGYTQCKRNAKWHFTALPGGMAMSGYYCLDHFLDQFYQSDEQIRYNEWRASN